MKKAELQIQCCGTPLVTANRKYSSKLSFNKYIMLHNICQMKPHCMEYCNVTKILIKANLKTHLKTNGYDLGNHFLRKMACQSAQQNYCLIINAS